MSQQQDTFTTDPKADEPDQEKRIQTLRAELEKLGGSTTALESMPADMEEEFLRHVLEYESTAPVTIFSLLENSGLTLPAPDQLDDATLTAKLNESLQGMAKVGAYLLHTNHLSDRELYEYLYNEGWREEAVMFPENPSYAYTIDMTGSGSDEDNQIWLKHYANDEYRAQWALDWPSDNIPARETAPYDRDRNLPQSPLDLSKAKSDVAVSESPADRANAGHGP